MAAQFFKPTSLLRERRFHERGPVISFDQVTGNQFLELITGSNCESHRVEVLLVGEQRAAQLLQPASNPASFQCHNIGHHPEGKFLPGLPFL